MGNLGDVDFMYLNENNLSGSIPDSLAGLLDAVSRLYEIICSYTHHDNLF